MMKQLFPVIRSLHLDHLLCIIWSTLHPLPRTTPLRTMNSLLLHTPPLAGVGHCCRWQVQGLIFLANAAIAEDQREIRRFSALGNVSNNFKSKDSMTVCIGQNLVF